MPSAARAAVMGALALGAGACSLVGVRPPSRAPDDAPLECTRRRVLPALDLALTMAFTGTSLMMVVLCQIAPDPGDECRSILWTSAGFTGAFAASSAYGYHFTSECRRLHAERLAPPRPREPVQVPDPEWLRAPASPEPPGAGR